MGGVLGCLLGSPDLREKFIKTESELFRHRFESDDANERQEFLKSLKFDWVAVSVKGSRWSCGVSYSGCLENSEG